MPCNSLTNFEYEKAFAMTRTYQFCCNLAKKTSLSKDTCPCLILDGQKKGQLIQLDYVTRIKLALRKPGQLAPHHSKMPKDGYAKYIRNYAFK